MHESLGSMPRTAKNDNNNNNLLKQKAPDPDGFTGEFYLPLKKQIISVLYNFFQKKKAEK
jgi:hypothetical protein